MTDSLLARPMHQLHPMLVERKVSSVELTRESLARIEKVDSRVRAFLKVTPERALNQAEEADRRIARGEATPVTGIPMALKDVLCTAGTETTAGSRILAGFVPPYDATVVARLDAQGAVFVGKTNCDEFAMGSSTENSGYFATANPWDLERVPGGSSGGSAAAVAAGEVVWALGSDTGGSIRQPAALCGVVGMKPTYGRVSRYGLIAFASSLDQVGPFTRDVRDCALAMNAISGHDPLDSTSADRPADDQGSSLDEGVEGMVLGVPREYFGEGLEPGVEESVRRAIAELESMGARIEEVSLPHTEYGLASYYIIAPAEVSSNLARMDGIRFGHSDRDARSLTDTYQRTRQHGFGSEPKRRIMLGAYALSAGYYDAYYLKAQKVRTLIKRDFDQAFERVQAIVCPTSPTVAFAAGSRTGDPLAMYLSDALTIPANLAGICGVSIPCDPAQDLPVGFQVIGPAFGEAAVLRVAHAYEQRHGHWSRVAEVA
ncbi:MAG: Asp-tRNA(Asn)/Glu-tRNA(Gln) amidotransferase subunit GatA [Candidatus Dormibacteria bacterium]